MEERRKKEGEEEEVEGGEKKNAPTARVEGIVRVESALVIALFRSLPTDRHQPHRTTGVQAERKEKRALWAMDARVSIVKFFISDFPPLPFGLVVDIIAIPIYLGAELADDDASGLHRLSAVDLDAAALCGVG